MSTPNTHPSFEFLRSTPIGSLNLTVEEYRHRITGAPHLHLAADNDENVFMVAFRTVPMDSTGVAHILEHTSLCGSERYPVRDPFFMMLRRSLNTFMNAFTSSDWTAYPFASQNRKDFDNLLAVYLDAAFFPKLDALDFAQEGHRLEFTEPENPQTPLVCRGVVYNEMKGAMSAPSSILWHRLCHHLFPTSTYHYNSGGEPGDIPTLSWQALRDFHATHYHPSNAMLLTFGDITAQEHQGRMEELVLQRFQRSGHVIAVGDEQRLPQPLRASETYPANESGDEPQTHVVTGWLLGESASLEESLQAQLLVNLLMDNSASPLMAALETTNLGSSPSPICGLEDSQKQMVFVAGLQGCQANSTQAVEALVLDTLRRVAQEGFPAQAIESALHQLEFHRREIGGDGYPYGLQLLLQALTSLNHRGDPVALLDMDRALEQLHKACENPLFPVQLLQRLLIDNTHRVTLTLEPDTTLAARQQADEAARLASIRAALDTGAEQALVEQARALKARQAQHDDPDILPKVTLADVPPDIRIIPEQLQFLGQAPLSRFAVGTNGLCYVQCLINLPADMTAGELDTLPYYARLLTELGMGESGYLEAQQQQSLYCGGFSASLAIRSALSDFDQALGYLVFSAKSLHRNHARMMQLMHDTLHHARFDETQRIRDVIAQTRSSRENSLTSQGHSLAMLAASASLNPQARLQHALGGLEAVSRVKNLDRELESAEAAQGFSRKLSALHQRILQGGWRFLVVGDQGVLDEYSTTLGTTFGKTLLADQGPAITIPALPDLGDTVWTTRTDVSFCARAYPTVPADHADAPALTVLAGLMRNGFLHRALREQGGAYGGGASHDTATGTFRFYSYRDPRLADTYRDFDASIQWALETRHPAQHVEEAILGVISSLDRPASPAGEAKQQYHQTLFGRSAEFRRRFRDGVLKTDAAQLQAVARRYLAEGNSRIAVLTPPDRSGEVPANRAQVIEV